MFKSAAGSSAANEDIRNFLMCAQAFMELCSTILPSAMYTTRFAF